MAKKNGYNYRVRRVDEEQETRKSQPDLKPIPMLEINGGGVAIAFFVLICASGFLVYLVHRAFSGVGMGTMVGCLVVAAILLGAIIGIFTTTIAKFRKDWHVWKVILTMLSYLAAVLIGVAVGLSMPPTMI